jgi:4-hydroxy-3-methylbut-2-en-1-yl diphosphate reductase
VRAPVVCAPLLVERAALGRGLPVRRTGYGPARSAAAAAALAADSPRPVLVAGVAGAIDPTLRPGDLVVADEVRGDGAAAVPVPTAAALAAALRELGLRVHVGPLYSGTALGAERGPAADGALAVDLETAWLAPAAGGGPFAAVRVIVDTPGAPLARPGTPARGLRALRALHRATPALHSWLAATGPREVVLAAPRSFCAGVERAIDTVERALDRHGAPVYVRRQIVHNAHVVRRLEGRGAVFVEELDDVPAGSVAVLAAHGVTPAVRSRAVAGGLSVIDATCPLVTKVHAEVRRWAGQGRTVFLVGHAEHEEVEGTVGEAPDDIVVVDSVATAARVLPRDPEQVAYAMQTTLAVDEAEEIVAVLRDRFPALQAPGRDDICYATTNRQRAVRAVAARSDLVLVVGSANSSNSRRLAEVAARDGVPAHLIDDAAGIDLRWLAGARRVGLSAGASAPDHLVDEVVAFLSALGPVSTDTVRTGREDVVFTRPKEVS